MTSGWKGAPCFRRYDQELASKPVILLKKKSWRGEGCYDRRTTLAFHFLQRQTSVDTGEYIGPASSCTFAAIEQQSEELPSSTMMWQQE